MSRWFEDFHKVLQGQAPGSDTQLIPAGTATREQMLKHVRYQFSSKTREAVEETFPKTIENMGEEKWDEVWDDFQKSGPASLRSLDEYAGVFLSYFVNSAAPHALKELIKFEWVIETHPWTNQRLARMELPALELSEEVCLHLAPLDIRLFQAPVMALYEGMQVFNDHEPQQVLFWLTDEGMRFHRMESWEESVLRALPQGLGSALAYAPDDAGAITEFFQWLGSSDLIRKITRAS